MLPSLRPGCAVIKSALAMRVAHLRCAATSPLETSSAARYARSGPVATICSLISAGYGLLVLGMKNTLLFSRKSVHQTGGTPLFLWTSAMGRPRYRRPVRRPLLHPQR